MNDSTKKNSGRNGRDGLRRWLGWGVTGLVVAAAAWWAFQPRALVVDTGQVTTGRFEQAIEEDGRLRLKDRFVIAAPTTAELARPTLKVGDTVQTGQVVATLTPVAPQMIDARTRSVLQQRVGSAEAARAAAAAQVARLETALAQAKLEAERAIRPCSRSRRRSARSTPAAPSSALPTMRSPRRARRCSAPSRAPVRAPKAAGT